MSDLIAFLRRCLDDDERVAREAAEETGPKWYVDVERDVRADNPTDTPYVACGPWGGGIDASTAQHIARHDPARVLAEVEAKRRILDLHQPGPCADGPAGVVVCGTCGPHGGDSAIWMLPDADWYPCDTVRLLAQPYAGRPGWREEWRA